MAWIESHDTLARHPKTKRLMRALNIGRAQAIGHLHLLWWWTLEFAQDGDLSRFAADELADAAEWEGDPATFLAALITAGFVDAPSAGQQAVHDWQEYVGRLLDQRERNAARQRAYRARQHGDVTPPPTPEPPPPVLRDTSVTSGDLSRNGDISVTSPSRNGATVPYRTKPDQTKPVEDLRENSAPPAGTAVTRQAHAPKRIPEKPLPQPYPLTEEMRVWAAMTVPDLGDRIDVQHAQFCRHYHGKGNERRTDWRPVWEKWMTNAVTEFAPRSAAGGSPHAALDKLTTKLRNIRAGIEADYAQWADDGPQDGDQGPADQHVPRLLPQSTAGRRGA